MRCLVILAVCSAIMVSCQSPTVPSPLDTDPHFEGEIDALDVPVSGLDHLANIAIWPDETQGCRDLFSLTAETEVWVRRGGRWVAGGPGDLRVGRQVRVWVTPGAHIRMCGVPLPAEVVAAR